MTGFHAPQILPGLYSADVIKQAPKSSPTYIVRLMYDGKKPPRALIDALITAGFKHNPLPIDVASEGYIVVLDLKKPGSAPFGRWTQQQLTENHAAIESIFLAAGIEFAPRAPRNNEVV